jgi:hypothetical protein
MDKRRLPKEYWRDASGEMDTQSESVISAQKYACIILYEFR